MIDTLHSEKATGKRTQQVGVFDSGIGGLTILQSLTEAAPKYNYLYLGDSARTPYGGRSFETILKFTTEAVEYLFAQDCQIIIIACNTSSAKALRTVQQTVLPTRYPGKRVLGVLRPSTEKLPSLSQSIAIWGTAGTVHSRSYEIELKKQSPNISVTQQACPMLVPLIENNETHTVASQFFIKKYWDLTLKQNPLVDTVLLACTHYPLILNEIKSLLPPHIKVLAQSDFIGPSWADYLHRHPELEGNLAMDGKRTFLTTDNPQQFNSLAHSFANLSIQSQFVDILSLPRAS